MGSELTVVRVRSLIEGSPLAEVMTDTDPADTENLKVEHITDFDEEGGSAVIEPGTDEEEIVTYESIDEDADELVDITRAATAFAHPVGAFVQAGTKPTRFKVADGFLDDEEELVSGVRIPRFLWKALKNGTRDNDDMQIVPVEEHASGLSVSDAPLEDDDVDEFLFTYKGALEVGNRKARKYARHDYEITEVFISVDDAPVNDPVIVDIVKNGTTIFKDEDLRPAIQVDEETAIGIPDRPKWKNGQYIQPTIESDDGGLDTVLVIQVSARRV